MEPEASLEKIFHFVRNNGQLVPRTHPTIGSFWTVETWVHPNLPDIKVQLQDEGSTYALVADGLNVSSTYGRPCVFYKGTANTLFDHAARVNAVANFPDFPKL